VTTSNEVEFEMAFVQIVVAAARLDRSKLELDIDSTC
jgi:hypothetical protein